MTTTTTETPLARLQAIGKRVPVRAQLRDRFAEHCRALPLHEAIERYGRDYSIQSIMAQDLHALPHVLDMLAEGHVTLIEFRKHLRRKHERFMSRANEARDHLRDCGPEDSEHYTIREIAHVRSARLVAEMLAVFSS